MQLLSEKLNLKMLVANLCITCFNIYKSFTSSAKCIHLLVRFTELAATVRFEAVTAVFLRIHFLWKMTLNFLVTNSERFEEMYRLHLQG
jgi:hypothetical protein